MMRVEPLENLAAVVFLRSRSGRSVRELANASPPLDLELYRAPEHARDTVRRLFESRGFRVFQDAQRLTLTLEAPPPLFASCFGVAEAALDVSRTSPLELEPPGEVKPLIEAISLVRRPFFPSGIADPTASPPEHAGLIGATIGRYRITGRLGSGGMGEVYRADDPQLRRTVAIKRLVRGMSGSAGSNVELLREARRASALNHPNIAGIYDVLTVENELFLVMEHVEGSTLRERLESALSVNEFCDIAIQCAHALTAAHQKGIVHGDLKPTNIMLTREGGDVKVCDFGLARRLPQGATVETTSTARRGIAGTPAYMAPEVLLERPADARADVFSLGVVFYEMLAGRNPFLADSLIATTDRIRTLSPEPLGELNPAVPPRLARAIHRMIDKDPSKRYASLSELTHELSLIRADLRLPPARRRLSRRAVLAMTAAVAALLTIAAVWRFAPSRRSAASSTSVPAAINLAVLPFASDGANVGQGYLAQGLTEALTRQLSVLTVNRKFQVATAGDIRARSVTSATDAREQLGANMVLTGSLGYSESGVRVTCQLIDTRTGRPLRSSTFTADASDPLAVHERIVQAGIGMLGFELTPGERAGLTGRTTQRPGAYDYYLQARGYLLNYDRIENLDSAIAVFRRALEIDPRYALAYAGLGQAYWRKHELTGAAMWVEPARGACEAALGIDAKLSEAHACLGMVLNGTGAYEKAIEEFGAALDLEPTNDLSYLGLATAYEKLDRPADAERTFRRAIELRPHYWGAYNMLGGYYYRRGRYDDALAMFQQVVALAPDSFRGHSSVGAVYFMKDQPQEAIAAFRRSLSIRANYVAASNLGTLYYYEGDYHRSVDAFRQALSIDPGDYQVWGNLAAALEWGGDADGAADAYRRARDLAQERANVNPRAVSLQMSLADYNAALGDKEKARAALERVLQLGPDEANTLFDLAVFYESRLDRRDDALKWLAAAIARGQTWREVDRSPYLLALRKDPRFQQLRHSR